MVELQLRKKNTLFGVQIYTNNDISHPTVLVQYRTWSGWMSVSIALDTLGTWPFSGVSLERITAECMREPLLESPIFRMFFYFALAKAPFG